MGFIRLTVPNIFQLSYKKIFAFFLFVDVFFHFYFILNTTINIHTYIQSMEIHTHMPAYICSMYAYAHIHRYVFVYVCMEMCSGVHVLSGASRFLCVRMLLRTHGHFLQLFNK